MTQFKKVYDSFFSKITDDMYMEITEEETLADCKELLMISIPLFEFPSKILTFVEEKDVDGKDVSYFNADLGLEEINILSHGMVQAWLQRQITTIELIRQKFSGVDFTLTSQAAHLKTLTNLFTVTKDEHRRLQMLHSRRRVAGDEYQTTFDLLMKR